MVNIIKNTERRRNKVIEMRKREFVVHIILHNRRGGRRFKANTDKIDFIFIQNKFNPFKLEATQEYLYSLDLNFLPNVLTKDKTLEYLCF